MGERQVRFVSVDDFMAWEVDQAEKHELVDGVVRLMTGARIRHSRITANIVRSLGNRLEGRRCFVFTSDTPIRTAAGNVRRPDAGIECGQPPDTDIFAKEPALVVEVLSDRTRDADEGAKLVEYMNTAGIRYVLHVAQDIPDVTLIARGSDGRWSAERYTKLGDVIVVPDLALEVPLTEVYSGLSFASTPDG